MVQLAEPDHNSDRGSLTDSGRGPSEEGETPATGHPVAFDMPRRISSKKMVTFCLPDTDPELFTHTQQDSLRTSRTDSCLHRHHNSDCVQCMVGYKHHLCSKKHVITTNSPSNSCQCDIGRAHPCHETKKHNTVSASCAIGDRYRTEMRTKAELLKKDDDCLTECLSDDDTTTSGSYIVDLNDVAEVADMYGPDTMV